MKSPAIETLLLGSVLFIATLTFAATTADLPQLVAAVAKYESGQNAEPLRQVEQLVRDAAGNRAQRAKVETALVELLAPAATFEAQRFACQQLAIVGSDASVTAIARLLQDEKTIGLACLAFGNRPSAKADKALRDTLSSALGSGRLQIISALGNRRDARAVSLLTKLTRETEMGVAKTAIEALGKIANEAAYQVIVALRKEARPELEQALGDASLRCAVQFADLGKTKTARAICEELVASQQPVNIRRGAFAVLARLDKDGGEQRILGTLHGGDPVLIPVAIVAVRSLRSDTASQTFARELPGLGPQEQVWLIESLAVRADAPARAALAASLGSPNATVRQAAASGLSAIGDASSVPAFARAIATAADADEARVLVSALGELPRRSEIDRAILAEIKLAQGEARARLITALATRPGKEVNAVLLAETENPDPAIARSAYRVLARAVSGDELALLVQKFAAIRDAGLRSDVAGFVEQAVTAVEPESLRTAALRGALDQAREVETRCALLALLPACGSESSLAALNEAAGSTETRVQDAAIRALAEWPTSAAWDSLAAVWRKTDNESHRSIALRGLVRLADEGNAKPDARLMEHYRELLAGARGDDERKLVLGALGGAAHLEALQLALALLDNATVRPEAEAAVKKIAKAIEKQNPEAAKSALEKLAK